MTLYGYARVSVREPEDKNLDLQVERLVRAGCAMGNIRAEEASGAKNDRGGLLELLDLVVGVGSKCVFASYRIPGSRFRGDDGNRRLETDILKLTTLPSTTTTSYLVGWLDR